MSAAILLSGFVIFLAVGCARSIDIDLGGEPIGAVDRNDDPPQAFWPTVGLAAYLAVVPLALIWLCVLVAYLARRVRRRAERIERQRR